MKSSMHRNLSLTSFAVVVLGHFTAVMYGWYHNTVWTDRCLHFIAGTSISFVFLYLISKPKVQSHIGSPSPLLIFLSLILASNFVSFLWEIWEFSMWTLFPARVQYFVSVEDTLSDIIFGTLGGIFIAVLYLLLKSGKKRG